MTSCFTSEINASAVSGHGHPRWQGPGLSDHRPSPHLLRLPDADAKAREHERFVDDLKIAAKVLRKSARAA